MNGFFKIKTKIDNKDVDKGVAELENKIKKLQTDNSELSKEENGLQKEIENYKKLGEEAKKYEDELKNIQKEKDKAEASLKMLNSTGLSPNKKITVNEFGTVDVTDISTGLNINQTEQAIANMNTNMEQIKQKYSSINKEVEKQASGVKKVYSKLEQVKAKQVENNAKISQFKQKIDQININRIQGDLNSVGKSIQSQIGKIGKMALAVFGVRTAFSAVRTAVSTLSQYYPEISANIDYIKYALSSTLLPVIQKLISLAYTLLSYINAIMSAWFGINLFENASVDNFKKMKNSAGGTAKSVKEIKKSLQGFDEMNVLQDNSNSSSGGGGGGFDLPSNDLSKIQGEVPAWLKWIVDNKGTILAIFAGIASGIAGMKLLNLLANLGLIKNELLGIKALGIGIAVAGIVLLIQDIIKFIKDPTFDNFLNILRDIAIVVIGIATALGAWVVVIGAAIALIVIEIIKHWDEIKEILGAVGQWIYDNVIKPVADFFAGLWDKIKETFSPFIEFFSNIFGTVLENTKIMIDNAKQIFSFLWEKIKEIFSPVVQYFGNVFKNAFEKVKSVFSPIVSFFSGLWSKITNVFKNIGQKIGQAVSGAFKSAVNAVFQTLENILNTPIRTINSLIGVINQVPGLNLGYLHTFNLPRLAKGGIIAQPTQAIIGEAGAEAVVPLENNLEWLDILADKLADKLNTNGVNNIYLDSRLIQRQIAKRNQQLAFTTNS